MSLLENNMSLEKVWQAAENRLEEPVERFENLVIDLNRNLDEAYLAVYPEQSGEDVEKWWEGQEEGRDVYILSLDQAYAGDEFNYIGSRLEGLTQLQAYDLVHISGGKIQAERAENQLDTHTRIV
ncbi:MAG: hypothetical protein ACLFTA_02875 [Candidatus Nanohaloarchaea archaeon]